MFNRLWLLSFSQLIGLIAILLVAICASAKANYGLTAGEIRSALTKGNLVAGSIFPVGVAGQLWRIDRLGVETRGLNEFAIVFKVSPASGRVEN